MTIAIVCGLAEEAAIIGQPPGALGGVNVMDRSDIVKHLGYRLPDCRGHLCSYYADQLIATGTDTTPEDAFSAWLKWVASQGGKPATPLTIDASPEFRVSMDRAAHVIREVARIGENPGMVPPYLASRA